MTLYRVRYASTFPQKDVPQHVWHFMETCATETDPRSWHLFSYLEEGHVNRISPYLPHIMGWQWIPMEGADGKRLVIYALLDCPVMATLWRIEYPRDPNEPEYEIEVEQ